MAWKIKTQAEKLRAEEAFKSKMTEWGGHLCESLMQCLKLPSLPLSSDNRPRTMGYKGTHNAQLAPPCSFPALVIETAALAKARVETRRF